ncbi:MAG: DUF459 domain-containing protein [Alphaproteobacteria bacterium]|nr:DUF459 domain-containing protein [Alphaproteobacteria bacterium]MBO6628614.1 DUF459 domain-containing protein [Alphaproteobacteria bacterium]MDF1626833.1 DUF459 domain-containing protein [Parvibaculaceae bacterium]
MRAQSIEFKWFFRFALGVFLILGGALIVWPARADTEVNGVRAPVPLVRPAMEGTGVPGQRSAAIDLRPNLNDVPAETGRPIGILAPVAAPPAQHRDDPAQMAPIPDRRDVPVDRGRVMNVVVLGDSLGDGLWAGLYRALKSDGRFNVIKRSKVSTGFVRRDYFDWNAEVERVLDQEQVDIAVVMIGTNDRQVLVDDRGRRHRLRSAGWEAAYKERVDRFTQSLKDRGVLVYWIGLPVMRSPRFGGDMQYFNQIYAERAAANGIPFIPTWDELADANGAYQAHGPDTRGRRRLLRADDGIHFTLSGYQVLASVVADDLIDDRDQGLLPGTRQLVGQAQPVTAPVQAAMPAEEARSEVEVAPLMASSHDKTTPAPVLRPGRADDWRWPRL